MFLLQKQEVAEVRERPASSPQRRSCGVESNQTEDIKGAHSRVQSHHTLKDKPVHGGLEDFQLQLSCRCVNKRCWASGLGV